MASVRLRAVSKRYPNGHVAARSVDLEIADGELMVLVGASGCGKSTLLRMIAGLETSTTGTILIGDDDVTRVPPQQRDVAMVFQSYALYPHKTVRDNLAFALSVRRVARPVIDRRIEEVSRSLGLEELLDRKPGQLSGGQRQRVALGRAIVREPRVFLFDEPLSNLDARLRVQTRAEIARLHRRLGATMVYVTHDQEEAMTLGDRIAVMADGVVQQCAPPLEVYRRPANVFVGGFVGSPSMNFVDCEAHAVGGQLTVECPAFALRTELPATLAGEGRRPVRLGIRPQDVEVAAAAEADLTARVELVEPLGHDALVHLDLRESLGSTLRLLAAPEAVATGSGELPVRLRRDRLHLFDASDGRRLAAET